MSARFTLAMARRESRSTRRRLILYIVAITLGVAALVAINSFRANVTSAVRDQARDLMGADLQMGSRWEFSDDIEALIDSLQGAGAEVSRVTYFTSMALAQRSGLTRLVEVMAPAGGYPFYGELTTEPPEFWQSFRDSRQVLVDPAALVQLDAALGDTLAIGRGRFVVAGTVERLPGDIGLRSMVGLRVYLPAPYLEETGLLRFGSISYHQVYFKIDDREAVNEFVEARDSLFEANRVWTTTVDEYEEDLTEGLDQLASFLGLVGLVALLLGGVGVASGVHVFVSEKLDTAAVLRCLGARQRQTFAIYLLQAGLMGLSGAALGVGLGVIVQALIPQVLRDFLPLDVPFHLEPTAVLAGLGIGLWVSLIFALLPLLRIKDVAPLRALRRDYEKSKGRRDPWRLATYAALVASLLALTIWQAPRPAIGLAFAAAAAITAGALGLTAWALMRLTRRFFPRRARFPIRQGIANLFRPHNQTVAVVLAIGSGVFLITHLYVVQRNLLQQITVETRPDRPNLVMFDIQPDQEQGVTRIMEEHGAPVLDRTPIVPARLTHVGDRSVDQILADSSGPRIPRWALLRQYRHTYRDRLVGSERLIDGEWFSEAAAAEDLARISIEESIAEELRVGVGDRITWDIQGVPIETEIASVRRVDWARFEPNFFAVFEPGVLDEAPQSLLVLTRVDDPTTRAELQRDLVADHPNVAAIDITVVIEAINSILSKVALAIRFMATFSIACGFVILIGAIATSRYQRARESVLLKTLGARSRVIGRILATEYFALGSFAGLAGVGLAAIAAWIAVRFLFEMSFSLPGLPLLAFWVGTALLTTAIGLANSRDVVRRTPLAGMRDFAE
ncbi:MAG: ABC transporter permease [Gemmatimonadales bacterium]|jgi:putative ABC transport system permease protein